MSGARPAAAAAVALAAVVASPVAWADSPWLVDVTAQAGLSFRHHAARSDQWLYPETFGAGAALLDVDADGDLDVLLLDTGSPPGAALRVPPRSELWRSVGRAGELRFERSAPPPLEDVAAMGACTGDVDGDGDVDVYVSGLPRGRLLLSEGGRLVAAPGNGGIEDPGWGTSCAFLDHDADGDLDLFVAHYVAWAAADERECGGEKPGFRSYCPPARYEGEANRLFAGDGRGRFTDVSREAGISRAGGKGLGVVVADFDVDGRADVLVANDQVPNFLHVNVGGRFEEVALRAGASLSDEGRARAGMGVDAGDVDADCDFDVTITHLDLEASALLINVHPARGLPRFRDLAAPAGLGAPTLMQVGWGTVLEDLDADGDLDLFAVNGHVLPNVDVLRPDQSHAAEAQLFEQVESAPTGPRLRDARSSWLPAASRRAVGRGLAAGDLDGDGDVDLLSTANDGPARLLRNDRGGRWLGLALVATRSAPGAPAAWATLTAGGRTMTRLRRTGGSYLSASDTRVLFGLGDPPERSHRVVVHWPSGLVERHGPLTEGGYHVVREGAGVQVATAAPARPRGPSLPRGRHP